MLSLSLSKKNHNSSKNFNLSLSDLLDVRFCFAGEFGYELISWIPYLLFLKSHLNFKLKTLGRPGSKVFYYFSDDHQELTSDDITAVWGNYSVYQKLASRFSPDRLVYPSGEDQTCQTNLTVEHYPWLTKNIHAKIDETTYKTPDYSFVSGTLPFKTTKKIIVINNKYAKEWAWPPINFYSREDLINLKNILLKKNYFVVYNRFLEITATDEYYPLNDADVFTAPNCYDMREFYTTKPTAEAMNFMQLSLFNRAHYVIGVQGGNVYLPSICRKNISMLMRVGDYIDYKELARIYGISLDAFYEPRHLELWLTKKL